MNKTPKPNLVSATLWVKIKMENNQEIQSYGSCSNGNLAIMNNWLLIGLQVEFQVLAMVCKVINGLGPAYLRDSLSARALLL